MAPEIVPMAANAARTSATSLRQGSVDAGCNGANQRTTASQPLEPPILPSRPNIMNHLTSPPPFSRPRFALHLRRAATTGALALLGSSCDSYTCLDLANCASPNLDAGSSTDASTPENTTESLATSERTDTSSQSTLTGNNPVATTSAGSTSTNSSSTQDEPSNGETTETAPSGTSGEVTSVDEPTGCTDLVEGCLCDDPSEELDCWETPDGTPISDDPADAIGDCRLGKRSCVDGRWTACEGAVAPKAADSCDRPLADDNCNGEPNEDCDCLPTDTRSCGTDEALCVAGVQTCGEDGEWDGECVGEVPPAEAEDCSVEGDANCDGEVNEGCECVGTEVEPCNDCGERACNPNTGRWGACEPVEESRCSNDATGIQVCDIQGNWKQQTCANDDEVHCDVSCTESGGAPSCAISAKDADDDGYRAAACAASPGNDCDDSTDLASPGATELCDGLDNDCDGFADARDSALALAGVPILLVGGSDMRRSDLAWHNSDFFIVADGKTANETTSVTHIYGGFAAAASSGTYGILTLTKLIEGSTDIYYRQPRVESAGGVLGGVILMDGRSWGTNFVTFANSGSLLTTTSIEGGPPGGGDLTKNGNAFVVTSHRAPTSSDTSYTYTFATGATNGNVSNVKTKTGMAGTVAQQSVAQSGTRTAAVFTDESPGGPSVSLMLWSNANNITGPIQLASPGRNAGIAALASGNFAVAWATSGGFRLQVRATNGNDVVCDSQDVAFGNGTLDSLDGVAVAESPIGIIVFATDQGTTRGRADLFVLGQDCQLESQAGKSVFNRNDGTYDFDRPHLPKIAVGQGKLGLAWTAEISNKSDEFRGYAMVLPDALCQ